MNYENNARPNKMESSLSYAGSTQSHTPQHQQSGSVTSEDGETLMLADLVRKYSKSLPLKVRVDEGFCGQEERSVGVVFSWRFCGQEERSVGVV